jgi:cytochrome c oxidase subunit 1
VNSHSIEVASGAPQKLARAWLWLASHGPHRFGLAGDPAGPLAHPGHSGHFPLKGFFRAALVVHVDLSVAIWFMAFAAVIWSALGRGGLAWLGWAGSRWRRWARL